jgi:hypothetical protein
VKRQLPDAMFVTFSEVVIGGEHCTVGNQHVYQKHHIHGAVYVALTEKGVQEISDIIHHEDTSFLKRFGKKIGLLGSS